MVTTKIKRLAALREKLSDLEHSTEAALRQELSELHIQYGFADLKSFFKAVKAAAAEKPGRRRGRLAKAAAAPKTRKRARITDAIRAKVAKLVKAGKSGAQIARAAGISLPSVQNIKKALGLVKSRKPEPKKAPVKKKAAKKRLARKTAAPIAPTAAQPAAAAPAAGE